MATETPANLLTLEAARAHCPSPPSRSSLWRWARHGVRSRSGGVVRLRHVRRGGMLLTSDKWLFEFFEQVAEADRAHFARAPGGTDRSGRREL